MCGIGSATGVEQSGAPPEVSTWVSHEIEKCVQHTHVLECAQGAAGAFGGKYGGGGKWTEYTQPYWRPMALEIEVTILLLCYTTRSRSRSGDRYKRGARGPRHHSSSHSRSSWSLSPSRSRSLTRSGSRSQSRSRSHSRSQSQSHSPSPPREKLTRPAASPAVGEKLKK